MKRYVPLGAYIGGQMLANMAIAWTVPKSRLYDLAHQGGTPGRVGSIIVAVLCAYGLLDILVSEALMWRRDKPTAFVRWLTSLRPWAWLLLAIANASQWFVAQRVGLHWLVSWVFLWAAVWCAACAWLALRGDYKAKMAACRAP